MRRHKIAAISAALVAGALFHIQPASAQDGGNIDLNYFRPAMDSRGYITVNASQTLAHTELSFGLVTNWGRNVLRFEEGDDEYTVENVISPTLVGAVGLGLGPIDLELGVSVPFNVMSGDRDPDVIGDPNDPNDDDNLQFSGQGVGDLGLHAKLRLLNTSKHPVGLALIGSVQLPTASESDVWIGEDGVVPQAMVVVDKEWGRQRRLRTAVTGGIRLRSGDNTFMSGIGGGEISAGSTIPFGAALAYAVSKQKFDVVGEVYGEIPLDGEQYFPAEAIVGIKLYLAANSFFTLGGGAGFFPDEGGNPDIRAFLGIVFEPNIGDRDGDGIKDDKDKCPDNPEDKDNFEDEDGCPELDNDQDGILDEDDDCPNVPEDKDGIEDEDGCPEGERSDRDGDGIYDDVDQCPDDPEDKDGFQDEDGCPDPDNDGDGILDVDDLCPNTPEDFDNFEDTDGCPEDDNDKDRIKDSDDQCPRVDGETREQTAETYNGNEDEDGCPDRGRVVVTDTKIEILDKIYFEYNSDKIKPKSFPILDAIVATLNGNPDILRVEIQGHTDERGSDSYNLDLSDRRAKSVNRYLVNGGVDAGRLEAQGYGETQPIDTRSNERAWAKNRRVEFLILKRSGER